MVNLGDTLQHQQQGVSSQNGIYRAAFPAFRIFIYGQEVSGDVTEVRINQSGGSMDRSPSTCSFSLVNIGDKYILDHSDMVALASGRNNLVAALGKNVADYEAAQKKLKDAAGEDDNVVADMTRILASSGQLEDLNTFLDVAYSKSSMTNSFQSYWADDKVPDKIKYHVMEKKATKIQDGFSSADFYEKLGAAADSYTSDPIMLNIDVKGNLYVYPFSEGDCIFHPNDPIRIAFRDPFDPSIWYWIFTGFMDGWVEDRGSNQESIVTIVGTDVTKIARYSSFQSNTDASLDKSITALFPGMFDSSVSELNWQAFQETFAKFSIFEILELLFFGKDNFAHALTTITNAACSNMNSNEVMTFLQNSRSSITTEDLKKLTDTQQISKLREIMTDSGHKLDRFSGSNFPPLSSPNIEFKTTFRRRSTNIGTYAFFVGKADNLDKTLGTEVPRIDMRSINDFLSHRVDVSDLINMCVGIGGVAYKDYAVMSTNDIVSTIGKDPWNFPVGAGRVVYVAPGGLGLGLADGVMNETTNAAQGGVHTEFKDRLTYFYDLAEQIQFCFYATPKGDVVFEMPFFDFDPWMFDNSGFSSMKSDLSAQVDQLEDATRKIAAWSKESASYSSDEIYEMMQLSSDLQLYQEGFTVKTPGSNVINYAQYFTVNKHETFGYSSAVNDSGLKTVARCEPHLIGRLDVNGSQQYQYAVSPGLAPTLGFRLASDKSPWTEIVQEQSARLFAAVDLRKCNSEARTVNLQILPKFGLMVNRPLYWRQRNYVANIVSCQHSIVPNSSCDTQVSLNYARSWMGEYKDKTREEKLRHFGGELPFSYEALLAVNKRSS